MNMPELLVVDFEFTLAPFYGKPRAFFPEIIEIGAVVVSPDGILTDKQYNCFVKPRFWPRITKECYGITGIKQEDINQGVSLETALYHLKQMVSANPYFVAWGDADRKVLGTVCQRYGIDYPFKWENYIDLAFEYKKFHQRKNLTSLKNAVEETHQQQNGICHAALDDAVNASLVLKYLIAKGWKHEVQALIA
jgi:sporulation inhibitor KapD